ncbi:RDD family protein [Puniceicoccaceae bacterium K14]|nr:RDD family protein [Puniceicoccaceae bacterium K14]
MKIPILPKKLSGSTESPYAGFWRRFGAFWIDAFIMLPWIFLIQYINNLGRLNYIYTIVPTYIFFIFFSIYTVKRWGGTPGKLLLKVIIVRKDGSKAGWKEAINRYIVSLVIGIPSVIGNCLVILSMSDDKFFSFSIFERTRYIGANMPEWHRMVDWTGQIWIWSEFIVLLLNDRKRALHDLIAGTVVIKKEFKREAELYGIEKSENCSSTV